MLYLDCFSGASGDMILGALLDLGLPVDALKSALGSLAVDYADITADRVSRAGVSATKFRLHEAVGAPGAPEHAHYHLKGIVNKIRRSSLKPESQERAVHLFERLAAAESAIHDTPIEKVHLHEVGALDSVIDIVGAVYGFDWFGIDDIAASPLNVGGGTAHRARGEFPGPPPATARLGLARAGETVTTAYGDGRLKTARRNGQERNASPEFEDCARLAAEHGVPVKAVQAAAVKARITG